MILWKKILCDRCMQKVYLYDGYNESMSYDGVKNRICYYHNACWYALLKEHGDKTTNTGNTARKSVEGCVEKSMDEGQ
jgi:hypothetical protein